MDVGRYNEDPAEYQRLLTEMYARHEPITLGPEYAHWITDNQLRLLIRLARYKFIARLLRPRDRVLEVGCGSGLGAIFLAQHCRSVLGIDVKQYEIDEAVAVNRRANVRFQVADFFEMQSEPFDTIVMLDVIEHMPEAVGRRLVARAADMLAPHGMLILGTPSVYSYPHQGKLSQASHVKCYDQTELLELIEKSFGRVLPFGMNDELVHTGHPKMSWYYFMVATGPHLSRQEVDA